jgi:hypothetical protein
MLTPIYNSLAVFLKRQCTHVSELESSSQQRRLSGDGHLISQSVLPMYHSVNDRMAEVHSSPGSSSLTCSTNPSLPSYDVAETWPSHGQVPVAPLGYPIQIPYSCHPEGPVLSILSGGFFPITASGFQRYDRNVLLCVPYAFLYLFANSELSRPRVYQSSYEIKSLTTSFSS